MHCAACGHANPSGARFCMSCGQALPRACPACGTEAPPGARFCMACAAPLETPARPAPPPTPHPSPPVETEPTAFANGRYQVTKFLGEGGKKKVYLAHDTLLDREVAFALIKTEGLDDTSRTRITREAQAMGRLGSHPHIVTVFDLGRHEGQPCMVTELMQGGDVEGLLEQAADHRIPLERAVEIAQGTCRGLAFAHAKGKVSCTEISSPATSG